MKRIGILTYHRAINYGAFLQCYSLVQYIQNLCPQDVVEVIDYETKFEFIVRLKHLFKCHSLMQLYHNFQLHKKFKEDRRKYLPLSRIRVVSNNNLSIARSYSSRYDVIIVGSDAVWSDLKRKGSLNYFLKGVHSKKFSYAASTSGLNINDINNDEKIIIGDLLDDFEYIGVREEKAEKFVKKLTSRVIPMHNCDPTCFITLSSIDINLDNKLLKHGVNLERPIICLMTENEEVGQCVRNSFQKTHQIVSIYVNNKYSDIHLYDLSPMEFAIFFKYVDILFSFYFHGCYLCLANGTPAIAVDEGEEPDMEETKIQFLFKRLEMEDRYYRPQNMDTNQLEKMIDTAKHIICEKDKSITLKKLRDESKYRDSFEKTLLNALGY